MQYHYIANFLLEPIYRRWYEVSIFNFTNGVSGEYYKRYQGCDHLMISPLPQMSWRWYPLARQRAAETYRPIQLLHEMFRSNLRPAGSPNVRGNATDEI